jgi:hypothetical protein
VLVGHCYGGTVITNAARDNEHVKALVFVAGYAPDEGENIGELSARFPGSTLADTLANGSTDLYIQQEKYHEQFAADVPLIRPPSWPQPSGRCGTSRSTRARGRRRGG